MITGPSPTASPVTATLHEDDTLLRIVLDRPKGNILSMAMMQAVAEVLAAHRADQHLRLVVIRGAGHHFSFGASVEEHQRDQAPNMLASFHAFIRDVADYPVPIAALVEGQCLGGAFELVLACRFVFATPSAVFGCPEIKLGVIPPVLAAIGALRVGGPLADRLLLTGSTIDAAGAERAGLVTSILAGGNPDEECLEWYRANLRPLSAVAIRQVLAATQSCSGVREALREPLAAVERQYVDRILTSRDGNEGITAYLERRKPVWEDR